MLLRWIGVSGQERENFIIVCNTARQVQADNARSDLVNWMLHMQRLQVVHYLLCNRPDLLPGYMILELFYKVLIVWMITVSQYPCWSSADHIPE